MTKATFMIDLRSDTVTLPTPTMRQAMFDAELGDDVMGEDPTANRLEALAAERMGKEAALFVPSGTMANLICLLSHCGRGDEVIMGHIAHMFLLEGGGCAAVGGIHPRTVQNQSDGTLDLKDIAAAVRDLSDAHQPRSRLICLENTHNRCGGAVLTVDYMAQVRALADQHNLRIHLDGARIFNAAVALGVSPVAIAREADSLSFCLSKGLSAPVGSLVCGKADFVRRARRNRKMLGGGMRQVGVLAAAGIVALEKMVDRLSEDHANARQLAEGLAGMLGIVIDPACFQTNIVIFELAPDAISPVTFATDLAANGVRLHAIGGRRFRAVTHYGIDAADIDRALSAVREVLRTGL
jgi:threonine aldolase